MLYFGGNQIRKLYRGDTPIKKVYYGEDLIFDINDVLKPNVIFDLSASIPSESNLAFTRNSSATYRGVDGKWRSVGNNVVRFHYLANGVFGLLIEFSVANRMTTYNANPTDTTGWTVGGDVAGVVSTVTAPAGSIEAAGLDILNTNGNALRINATGAATPVTVTSTGTAGVTTRCVVSAWLYIVSGSVMLSRTGGGTPETLVIPANGGFVRHGLSTVPNATTDNFVISVSGGGDAYVLLEQMEANSMRDQAGNGVPSTPIVTTGATGFRGVDVLQDASFNTRSYFNATSMAIAVEVVNFGYGTVQHAFSVSQANNAQNYYAARMNNDNGYYRRAVFVSNVAQSMQATHKPRLNEQYPVALAWNGSETALCAGYDSLVEPLTAAPDTLTELQIGALATNNTPFFGLIRSIAFWNSYVERRDMQAHMFGLNDYKAIFATGQSNQYGFFRAQIDQNNAGERNARAVMDTALGDTQLNVLLNGATNGSLAFLKNPNPATDFWWCTLAFDDVTLTLDGNAWVKWQQMAEGYKEAEGELLGIMWGQGDGGIAQGTEAIFKAATLKIFEGMREIFPDMPILIDPIGRYVQSTSTTSTSSVTIGTGTKNFTTAGSGTFGAGSRVMAMNGTSFTNYMVGTVVSHSGTSLVLSVDKVVGSGSFSAWNLSVEAQNTQPVRDIHKELADEYDWISVSNEKANLPLDDSVHLDDVNGYGVHAPNVVRDVLGQAGMKGPEITGATRTGTTVTITIAHDGGTDINFNSNAGNFFRYFDGVTQVAITGAAKVNATTITLTLASTPSGSNTETLYHIYNISFGDEITKAVTDNSANTLMLRSYKGEVTIAPPASPPVLESFGIGSSSSDMTSHMTADPTGIQDGELLVLKVMFNNNVSGLGTWTPPTGFVEKGPGSNVGVANHRIALKVASGESGSYSWSVAAASQSSSEMLRISNWSGDINDIQVAFAPQATANMSNSAPIVNAAYDNSLIIESCARRRGGGIALDCPPDLVAVVSSTAMGTGLSETTLGVSQHVQATAGNTSGGLFEWTSNTAASICSTIVIPPPS